MMFLKEPKSGSRVERQDEQALKTTGKEVMEEALKVSQEISADVTKQLEWCTKVATVYSLINDPGAEQTWADAERLAGAGSAEPEPEPEGAERTSQGSGPPRCVLTQQLLAAKAKAAALSSDGQRADALLIEALRTGPLMDGNILLKAAHTLAQNGSSRAAKKTGEDAKKILTTKCVVFLIDRSWKPILAPAIKAVQSIFKDHINDRDLIGLYSLGDGWLFKPMQKKGNEAKVEAAIREANAVGGRPHLNPSLLACLAELHKVPSPTSRWLVALTDTVDLEYEQVLFSAPSGGIPEGQPPKKAVGGREMPPEMAAALKKAGAKTGAVTISLMWDNRGGGADLDLHVICPDRSHISYSNKRAGGGELDVDMQARARDPVENVFFKTAKVGNYRAFIRNYSGHSPKPWRSTLSADVPVRLKGSRQELEGVELKHGTCRGTDSSSDVTAFEFEVLPGAALSPIDKQAAASLAKRGSEVVGAIKKLDVNLALIDSKTISGWEPESPRYAFKQTYCTSSFKKHGCVRRWPHFKSNVERFVDAAGRGRGHHLNAANASDVAKRFVRSQSRIPFQRSTSMLTRVAGGSGKADGRGHDGG